MATQKLSAGQLKEMKLLPFGKKHPVRAFIEMLAVGESLHISRADFTWKRQNPNRFCRQIAKEKKRQFRIWKEYQDTGWVVERVE